MKQHSHYTSEFKAHKFPIVLVCDGISNAANVGGLFRTADAFGVEKIIFCGDDFSLGRRFKKTSRSTENHVDYHIESNIINTIESLKSNNYTIVALEITDESQTISKFKVTNDPIALIIGNEITGISPQVLGLVHKTLHIDMYGQNSSMNVTQATSICLYHITQDILKL